MLFITATENKIEETGTESGVWLWQTWRAISEGGVWKCLKLLGWKIPRVLRLTGLFQGSLEDNLAGDEGLAWEIFKRPLSFPKKLSRPFVRYLNYEYMVFCHLGLKNQLLLIETNTIKMKHLLCWDILYQWFSTFLMWWPFSTVPHVMVTPNHEIIFIDTPSL